MKKANIQTPYMGTNIKNTRRGGYLPLLSMAILVAFLMSFQNAPAHAQGVFSTPTPRPALVATQNAAQQVQATAQASLQQAAQLEQQAAELKRNAEAQAKQAQADINAARQAQAEANAVAVGEAIGRVESTLNQLRDTTTGQANIISTLTAKSEAQAQQIITLTNDNQSLRVDKQTIQQSYDAKSRSLDEVKQQSQQAPVVTLVIAILALCIFAVLIVVVLQRSDDPQSDVVDTSYNVTHDDTTPSTDGLGG